MQLLRARQLDLKVFLGGPATDETGISISHDRELPLKTLKIAAAVAFGIKVKGHDSPPQVDMPGSDPSDGDNDIVGNNITAEYVKSINEKYSEGIDESDLRIREYNATYK